MLYTSEDSESSKDSESSILTKDLNNFYCLKMILLNLIITPVNDYFNSEYFANQTGIDIKSTDVKNVKSLNREIMSICCILSPTVSSSMSLLTVIIFCSLKMTCNVIKAIIFS